VLFRSPVFYVKLASIGLALWIGMKMKRRLSDGPDTRVSASGGRAIAAVSLSLWTVAIVAGRLMAYLKK